MRARRTEEEVVVVLSSCVMGGIYGTERIRKGKRKRKRKRQLVVLLRSSILDTGRFVR